MQSSVGHGSEQRINRRDAIRGGFARRSPPDLLDVFVANRDRSILVPGVGFAIAALGLHEQGPWQTEGAEKLAQVLERAYFLQLAVNHLMRGVLRRDVINLDPVWLCGARLRGRRNIGSEKGTNKGDRRNQEKSQRAHHARSPHPRDSPYIRKGIFALCQPSRKTSALCRRLMPTFGVRAD